MSGYGLNSARSQKAITPVRRIRKKKQMKISLKQRFRNWLMNSDDEDEVPQLAVEPAHLESEGMRMQIYKATGGYVVETRIYDRRTDRNFNSMHVIREDQDLGDALGKIVMMEALRS